MISENEVKTVRCPYSKCCIFIPIDEFEFEWCECNHVSYENDNECVEEDFEKCEHYEYMKETEEEYERMGIYDTMEDLNKKFLLKYDL